MLDDAHDHSTWKKALHPKVKEEFKNKRGDVFDVGTTVNTEFEDTYVRVTSTVDPTMTVKVPYRAAHRYLTGFKMAPATTFLTKMAERGIVSTPLGSQVEPDGHGPYGEPSWLIALGLI